MRLSPANPRDAARLAEILADWKDETPWLPDLHSRDEDAYFLARLIAETEVLTARNWRGLQGFLARDGEIVQALYVAGPARCRGVGRQLLGEAKRRSNRLSLWTFQANARARAFYAREGFCEAEATDGSANDENLPDVRLVWERE